MCNSFSISMFRQLTVSTRKANMIQFAANSTMPGHAQSYRTQGTLTTISTRRDSTRTKASWQAVGNQACIEHKQQLHASQRCGRDAQFLVDVTDQAVTCGVDWPLFHRRLQAEMERSAWAIDLH